MSETLQLATLPLLIAGTMNKKKDRNVVALVIPARPPAAVRMRLLPALGSQALMQALLIKVTVFLVSTSIVNVTSSPSSPKEI